MMMMMMMMSFSILAKLLDFIVFFILNFYCSTYVLFSVIGAIQMWYDDDDDDDDIWRPKTPLNDVKADKFIRNLNHSQR